MSDRTNLIIEAALRGLPEYERPGAAKLLEKLHTEASRDLDQCSAVLATVDDNGVIELAGDMLRASYRRHKAMRDLRLAEKREELSRAEFWMAANQRYGLDDEGRHFFDPASATIREMLKQPRSMPQSVRKTAEKYAENVAEVLDNPLLATAISHDDRMPTWLRSLAAAVTEPDLRPGLRRAVEESLDDPAVARRWHDTAFEDGMPDWMAAMFGVLALRKRHHL